MDDQIVNRIANSALIQLDLETLYPENPRKEIDLKPWLFEGLILKEKDFRAALKAHDWEQYRDSFVAVNCSSNAIIPSWAYMLVSSYVAPMAKIVQQGSLTDLEQTISSNLINNLDLAPYRDKPVIIKGCSDKPIPENAYVLLTSRLMPVAKSVMFGEACSSVPIYKRPK